jgi:hypothetical protein
MKILLRGILFAAVACAAADVRADAPFLNGFFPIGVWVPPPYDYAKWQGRGINTINEIAYDESGSIAMADSLGLHMMRAPQSNPADDANETLLLAWAHPDEPDGIYSQVPYATIQAEYATWKSIAPNRPVFINFVGDLNQYDIVTNESGDPWYEKYVAGADWISADKYPVNDGEANNLGLLGQMADHLHTLGGSKPVFAFIESSHIDADDGGRGPTADELRAEIWELIIHGVRGYFFFPEQISPSFLFDTTPTDVVTEMTKQNAVVATLAPVLQGSIDPPGMSAKVSVPLEAAWRSVPSARYFFVLNLSNVTRNSQTIALSGIGNATSAVVLNESRNVPITASDITDNFGPYALHIYVVAVDEIFGNGFD